MEKSGRLRRAGLRVWTEEAINMRIIGVRNPLGKQQLGRSRRNLEENIVVNLMDIYLRKEGG
jgi:hypothetical protein